MQPIPTYDEYKEWVDSLPLWSAPFNSDGVGCGQFKNYFAVVRRIAPLRGEDEATFTSPDAYRVATTTTDGRGMNVPYRLEDIPDCIEVVTRDTCFLVREREDGYTLVREQVWDAWDDFFVTKLVRPSESSRWILLPALQSGRFLTAEDDYARGMDAWADSMPVRANYRLCDTATIRQPSSAL